LRQELPRNPDLYLSPDTLIRFVADAPPCGQIGRDCNYSETNYIVAGLVIEAAAGQRFHELVRELFLGPLALADTEPAIRRDLSRLATGYSADCELGFPPVTVESGRLTYNPASEWTGGGFVSTSRDLARWAHAYFRGNALPGSYLAELWPVTVIDRGAETTTAYGLGCYVWEGAHGRAIGHSGEAPGYRSALAWFEQADAAVAVQVNSSIVDAEEVTGLMLRTGETLRD